MINELDDSTDLSGTLEFAKQDIIDSPKLEPFISRILEVVGHPEAFVTDESTFNDFCTFGDIGLGALRKKIRHELGINVSGRDTLLSVAQKLCERSL